MLQSPLPRDSGAPWSPLWKRPLESASLTDIRVARERRAFSGSLGQNYFLSTRWGKFQRRRGITAVLIKPPEKEAM